MIDLILNDAASRPELFRWFGAIERAPLDLARIQYSLVFPGDLLSLWEITGGGDMFESETILSPLSTSPSDNIDIVSGLHWRRGLDRNCLVFHTGLCLSVVCDFKSPHFVALDESTYREIASFDDLDAWYLTMLRAEYAARYKLSPPSLRSTIRETQK